MGFKARKSNSDTIFVFGLDYSIICAPMMGNYVRTYDGFDAKDEVDRLLTFYKRRVDWQHGIEMGLGGMKYRVEKK